MATKTLLSWPPATSTIHGVSALVGLGAALASHYVASLSGLTPVVVGTAVSAVTAILLPEDSAAAADAASTAASAMTVTATAEGLGGIGKAVLTAVPAVEADVPKLVAVADAAAAAIAKS